MNANGAVVTINCPHCTGIPIVCSVTTEGTAVVLNDNARSASVTFTTNGCHYYIIAEVADHDAEVVTPEGGKVEISDPTPEPGLVQPKWRDHSDTCCELWKSTCDSL